MTDFDRFPTAAELAEYHRRLEELRAAQEAGADTRQMRKDLTAFMASSGFFGENCTTDEDGEPN